jgi:hypothetical protein
MKNWRLKKGPSNFNFFTAEKICVLCANAKQSSMSTPCTLMLSVHAHAVHTHVMDSRVMYAYAVRCLLYIRINSNMCQLSLQCQKRFNSDMPTQLF